MIIQEAKSSPPSADPHPCEKCKRFCVSRPMIRKQREVKKDCKTTEREWNKSYRAAVQAGIAQEEF